MVYNVVSAALSQLEADTPSLLGDSRVPSAITVTFSLSSGMLLSVCEWRIVKIFENVMVGPNFGPERRARSLLPVVRFRIVFPPSSCSERGCDQTNVGHQFQLMDRKCHPPGYADTRNFGGAHQRILFLDK